MSQPDSLPDSQEACSDYTAPREPLWREIDAWAKDLGKRELMTLLLSLENTPEYAVWLAGQLGIKHAEKGRCSWAGSTEASGDISFVKLSPDPSRTHGYRVVTPAGLRKKMRDITVAGEWRPWDIVVLCHIAVEAATEPVAKKPRVTTTTAAASAGASVAASAGVSDEYRDLVYADFHHRACALHALCALHRHGGHDLPDWLKTMAGKVPFRYVGKKTRAQLVGEGFGQGASLQEGVVKQSWMDLVLEVIENRTAADTIQETVETVCPEHAAAIANWQHLRDLTTRVCIPVYEVLSDFMVEHDLATPPVPMAWLREPWLLLPGRKSKESCSEEEQILAIRRLCVLLVQLAQKDGPSGCFSLQAQLHGLWRRKELDGQARRNMVRLCKKYLAGMAAAATANKVSDYDDLVPRFLQGDFDGTIHATSDPTKTGKYWEWVKEAQAQAEQLLIEQEHARLTEQAAAAEKEADALMQEVEVEQDQSMAAHQAALEDSIAMKMEVAYRKALAAYALTLNKVAKDTGALAEELWVKHQDAEAAKRQQAQEGTTPWCLLETRREGNILSDKQLPGWITLAPQGKPLLFWLDMAIGDFAAPDLKTCLFRCGSGGVVVAILSDPVGTAGLVQKEHDFLAALNLQEVVVFRVFLQWRGDPGQPQQQGWLLILANTPAQGTLEECSPLLARVCKSVAVASGALLGLPQLEQRKVDNQRHAVLSTQRGRDFYSRVLLDMGVMTQLMMMGMEAPDFTFIEVDAGVGECVDVLAAAHRKNKAPECVVWIGGVTSAPCKRSATNCHMYVAQVIQEHRDAVVRGMDTTVAIDPRYHHCASQVPLVPEPAKLLQDKIASGLIQPLEEEPVPLKTALDLSSVEVLDKPTDRSFRQSCAATLALAMECAEHGVVVGYSFLGQQTFGLYPTKNFKAGDIIVFGLSGFHPTAHQILSDSHDFSAAMLSVTESLTCRALCVTDVLNRHFLHRDVRCRPWTGVVVKQVPDAVQR